MCDTFVAMPGETSSGNIIFGKNSDREPNEAQTLIRIPRMEHKNGDLKTTYISIPQISETNEIILSKPFWMWGAEMGANEHGLVIGNEAVFTKLKIQKEDTGLTGMDMIRLALERTGSAEQALELITELLEQYGQNANGGYQNKLYYHNSFILADHENAFVLETADRYWAAIKVKGFRSISNGLTIESDFDYSSSDLIDKVKKEGLLKKGEDFSFRACFTDRFYTYFSKCKIRQALTMQLGGTKSGKLDVAGAISILRSHGLDREDKEFHPSSADIGIICMHATGLVCPSETAGSLVAQLRKDTPSTYWFTGGSTPCTSLFKPFFMPGDNIRSGDFIEPGAKSDNSLWWKSDRLSRMTLVNYPERIKLYKDDRDRLENDYISKESELINSSVENSDLNNFSSHCLDQGNRALDTWSKKLEDHKGSVHFAPVHSMYRSRLNKACGVKIK